MPRDGYADKIAKLLAMAERAADEMMAANYLAKANELRLSQVVSDADIRAAAGTKRIDEEFVMVNVLANKNGFAIKARRELMLGLASINNVRITIAPDRSCMSLYGFASDVAFVEQMHASLVLQMASHMEAVWRDDIGIVDNARSWKTSFAHGYVARVVSRLADVRARAERTMAADRPGTALVLRDRSTMVKHRFDDAMGNRRLRPSYRNTSVNSNQGLRAGYTAGANADLGATRVGGDRHAIER